jgi:hypothetical protein
LNGSRVDRPVKQLKDFAKVYLEARESRTVWLQVQVLLLGAILAPGHCTLTAVLRIIGLSMEKHFQNYHRVLNRAVWSSRETSRVKTPNFSALYPLGSMMIFLTFGSCLSIRSMASGISFSGRR